MKLSILFKSLLVLPLLAAPAMSFAQQYQKLFDIDTSYDWGTNIFLQSDSSYRIFGTNLNPTTDNWELFNVKISTDGNTMSERKNIIYSGSNLYTGISASMQKIQGGYLSPLSIQFNSGTYWRGWGGMIKYNSLGDTIFTRTYTDTSTHFDAIVACAVLNNNDYILGGSHDYNTPSYYPAYLIRTDSMGDTIWTHTYQKFSDQESRIINIIPLADGRIVVGAMTTELINLGPPDYYSYYYNRPWFLTLDSAGNILKDTLYSERYMVAGGYNTSCGSLYKDRNGGYIDIGTYDSLYTTDPSDFINFPGYIAHLDTNFRITWITSFPYMESGHRQPVAMKQLKDSGYVIIGDNWDYYGCGAWSWAAKIKVGGEIVWNRIYYSDTNHCAYIRDLVERPDCGLIYTGTSMNDSIPTWHTTQDLWLVGVDSNGCDDVYCGVVTDTATQVGSVVKNGKFSVYPNPTNSILNFEFPASGIVTIKLMDVTGTVLDEQVINTGTMATFDVKGYASGLYLYQVITAGNTQSGKFIVK